MCVSASSTASSRSTTSRESFPRFSPSFPNAFLPPGCLAPLPLDSTTDRPTDLSAQIFLTFAVTKTGAVRLSAAPTFFTPERVQSSVEIKDADTKALLARPLKAKPVKKPKKVEGEEEKTE